MSQGAHDYPVYNYPHFLAGPDEARWTEFQRQMHVGSIAPDFEVVRLDDGATVRLSEYTAERTVVLEFGSYT